MPNIPCNARENIVRSPMNQQKCSGLNPDNIYNTLYPSDSDPLVDYAAHNSKKLTTGSKISSSLTTTDNCAKSCNNKNNCTYFTVEKDKNKCLLFTATSTSANDKFDSLSSSNSLQTWRKNNLLEGSSNCNLEDNFIKQPSNFFPDVKNYRNSIQTISQPDLSKNECLSACLYDSNCKSVVFAEAQSSCEQYNTTRDNAFSRAANSTYDNDNSKTFIKNANPQGNRFGAPDNLANYYKQYPKKGKIGDSFCELVDDKCKTSYVVGPNDKKQVPKSGGVESAKNIPAPKICMPPHCIPDAPETGLKGILKVNGNMNIMCKEGDAECKKNITKTPYFTNDQMGLPTKYGNPSPTNPYLPYTAEYNKYNNLKLASTEMIENPPIGAYEFPEGCKNWCSNSMDCGGYSYKFGTDGKAQCKYYQNEGMKVLRDSLQYENQTTANIKRGNPLIQNPKLGKLKKPYFNNYTNQQLQFNKVNRCINANKYIPSANSSNKSSSSSGGSIFKNKCKETFTNMAESEEYPYGLCPTNNIPKTNSQGSNCPTPLIGCEETTYGCCSDNQTAKINKDGDNCPILDKSVCLNSKYGCCPGTIIPKKYLCENLPKEEEEIQGNPMCNITNCGLNDRMTGDPYAFTNGSGKYCTNNDMCGSGEMCVNGFCKKYNTSFYNSLNFVQSKDNATKSGSAFNDYIFSRNTSAERNKECSDAYEPVCGTNGKNYQNSCKALNSGTNIQHYGTCENLMEMFYGNHDIPEKKTNKWHFLFFILLFILIIAVIVRI